MSVRPNLDDRGSRLTGPVLVLAPLAWLMVGCVYLPWFEQKDLTGTVRDFRGSGGDPIVDWRITTSQIINLLGPPAIRSNNGREFVYTLSTNHGIWIAPLAWYATPGDRYLYALGLRFTANGRLEHHHLATIDVPTEIGSGSPRLPTYVGNFEASIRACEEINRDNGLPPSDVGVSINDAAYVNAFTVHPRRLESVLKE